MKRVVSLCTGYGGLDLAVHNIWPDARTVIAADIEPAASKLIAMRHPTATNIGNVMTVDWAEHPVAHRPHILTAGYPCQPFSNAGKKKGFDDDRNIWPGVLRAIRDLRPKLVVLENVRHHLRLGFDRVLGDLAEAGFDAEWGVYRACDVGAPHRRERLFVVAHPSGDEPERRGGRGPLGSPTAHAEGEAQQRERGGDSVVDRGASGREDQDAPNPTRPVGTPAQHEHLAPPAGPAAEPRERPGTDWGPYRDAIGRWEGIVGRPAPVPHDGKRVSPRFVEWMMGLRAGYVTSPGLGLSRSAQLKMLGNGVVPQQAEHAIRDLLS
jgi:DNA (cytosine-5)-methyltransferase 1